jgi:serine/threonine-protein kinase RsbT
MQTLKTDSLGIRASGDIVHVRQTVRAWAIDAGFSLVDQTKIVTAASELARNTLEYGRGGTMRIDLLLDGARRGLRLTFEDQGPGIPDVALALSDGYTTGSGLGLGLSGSRRLMSEFRIESTVGRGTLVEVVKWR